MICFLSSINCIPQSIALLLVGTRLVIMGYPLSLYATGRYKNMKFDSVSFEISTQGNALCSEATSSIEFILSYVLLCNPLTAPKKKKKKKKKKHLEIVNEKLKN